MSIGVFIGIGIVVGISARLLFLRAAPGGWPFILLLSTAGSMFAGVFVFASISRQEEAAALSAVAAALGSMLMLLGYWFDFSKSRARPPCHGMRLRRRG